VDEAFCKSTEITVRLRLISLQGRFVVRVKAWFMEATGKVPIYLATMLHLRGGVTACVCYSGVP